MLGRLIRATPIATATASGNQSSSIKMLTSINTTASTSRCRKPCGRHRSFNIDTDIKIDNNSINDTDPQESYRHRDLIRSTDKKIPRLSPVTSTIMYLLLIMMFTLSTSTSLISAQDQQVNNNASSLLATQEAQKTPSRLTTTTSIATSQSPILASFQTPNQAINITHVTYDPLHDTVYLGATNSIYQLSGSDLSEVHEQSTGPIYDNPSCGITECHGYEDFMKPMQNVNKILVIDYQHKKLISCGSTKQGACRRYQLNNITQKEDLTSMAVAANDDNSSTYGFIAPARYDANANTASSDANSSSSNNNNSNNNNNKSNQQVLYVASTYTKAGQSRDLLVPAIGTRILDDGPNLFKLYENSFLDSARIDINSHLRDYFLVNYLYGFASSNYIYFVTVQKKATSRDYEELGYHTRLARICITDSSYNSYTEVDLKCTPNKRKLSPQSSSSSSSGSRNSGVSFFSSSSSSSNSKNQQPPEDFPLLQDAILVDAGSHLLQSLAQNDQSAPMGDIFYQPPTSPSGSSDDSKVLLGVFSSAKDHTQHAGDHSAICAFSLAQIEEKFNDNIHNCYTGKMQSRNMEYIAGNVQECPKSGQGGNVVNFCHETLKINGTIPIVSEASIQFHNTTLTAITATSQVNSPLRNIYTDELNNLHQQQHNQQHAARPTASSFSSNQHTVVFAGTSSGHIKKLLLNNASAAYEFEDVQLDTNPILGDLHVHSSGQQLIAATPYKVMKIPTHNCGQYSTCRECSQSRNPYCGWCSLKRSCTTKHECGAETPNAPSTVISSVGPRTASGANLLADSLAQSTSLQQQQQQQNSRQPLKWISNDSAGKCIDLQSIVPDKIPITSNGKVDLYIDRLPRLAQGQSYKCIFDRRDQTQAQQTAFGLTCQLPKLSNRPKIQPGRDHVNVDLAVRFSETNTDFLNGRITFFECQLHTTCKDCLTTNWGCNWCLNENICLFNASKCEKTGGQLPLDGNLRRVEVTKLLPTTPTAPMVTVLSQRDQKMQATRALGVQGVPTGGQANTISLVSQCPTFDVGHKQDILVADGSERELAIKVKNMPQFKGNIQCIVEIENNKIPLKARIEDGRVICENSTFSYQADVGLLTGQLVAIYSDNNIFIDRTNFTLYKCHLLGAYLSRPDCSLCHRIDSRFQCAFCSGSCQFKPRCLDLPEEKCPAPRIDFVQPTSGPTLGGTKVTIEGSNLGKSFEAIENRVMIGNVPCRPIEEEYRPSNKIVCITGPVVSKFTGNSFSGKRPLGLFGDTGYVQDSSDLLVPGDVMVGNEVGYAMAPTKFMFKSIYLRDHQPRYGPQSGGTRVTLFGMNLNIGSNVQVFLDELPCLIEPSSITSEQLVCRTSASRQASRTIKQLKLIVDDAQIIRDDEVFYYTQDPTITKISPLRSYLSGGRPINVYGTNLTSVQQPRMVILDAANKKVNESSCIIQDDFRIQCPSPAVNLQLMDLEWSEQQIGSYEPQPFSQQHQQLSTSTWTPMPQNHLLQGQKTLQHDESVKFKISFIMDNVWRLRDLQTSYPALQSEIAYTSDPKLYPFSSVQYKSAQELFLSSLMGSQGYYQSSATNYQLDSDTYLLQPNNPMLVLHGEHLGAAVSEYDITVTVGYDVCNLTELIHTRLVCTMPLDHMAEPTDEEHHPTQRALPLVVVRIGFNLRYELGYVQYHPQLVDQIVLASANSSDQLTALTRSSNYIPSENKSLLQRISSYITTTVLLLVYLTFGSIILALIYSGALLGYKLKYGTCFNNDYERIQAKVDSLEKSVKNECRLASLALQSDLNELVRHVELTGTPLLNMKNFVMKVFFPGINNHPLMSEVNLESGQNHQQDQASNLLINQMAGQNGIQRPLAAKPASSEFPMEHFERLVLTKPFLITFINTLEQQSNFTIRDKVNVASLIMIILIERLDYATDILRTLLFQLVQKYVHANQIGNEEQRNQINRRGNKSATLNLTRKASNLLGGLPTNLRGSRNSNLSKIVDGGASSLMASTQVAAQMLLSRVGGNKTSPLQQQHETQYMINSSTMVHGNLSTTTAFNQRVVNATTTGQAYNLSSSCGTGKDDNQSHLMLRKTDSVVEKMLTNWLALNMYDYFYGDAGQSLYMMFEALKGQLERGPVDAISGDAFYSLNENKLLREPHIQFEVVNLYVIADTDILEVSKSSNRLPNNHNNNNSNLLLNGSSSTMLPPVYSMDSQSFYEDTMQVRSNTNYSTSNTITLALRVLDCDTISQVKSKILGALYRNSPYSSRLTSNDVELSLRQQQPLALQQQHQNNQFVAVTLNDDDYSSLTSFDGMKRINTLRHYGVTDQAIMMLKRCRQVGDSSRVSQSINRTTLTDMLDEHYNNPYSEIQYGPTGGRLDSDSTIQAQQHHQQQQQVASGQHHFRSTSGNQGSSNNNGKSWHLSRHDEHLHDQLSNNSSPMSNSPSMMLLGGEPNQITGPRPQLVTNHQQQQFYHPSSSSTSSGGNVMDTNSTSANSSSINVGNLLTRGMRAQQEQPIYCQIGSVSTRSQHGGGQTGSSYYCQIGANQNTTNTSETLRHQRQRMDRDQENQIYLSRMLTSKGTIQNYIDDFFKTILSTKPPTSGDASDEVNFNQVLCGDQTLAGRRMQHCGNGQAGGACPPAVKWLFDLLDEAAMENGITDQSIIHSWKSNAFLLRFWMNFIKNPNYILDVEKSNTLDASLSTIAQTLIDSCSSQQKLNKDSSCNKMLFANDVPKYKNLVKRFYQDIASMRPVSDQEIVKRMGSLSVASAGKFDTNLALKELCVYAVNYGVEIMNALNTDYTCQQMNLSQQLEQCFRSFTLFEAYR